VPPAAEDTRAVVVCDRDGNPIGRAGVLEAHQAGGVLHRAFSAFVFRHHGRELLLQQRSPHKRLFASRWANTCCSHPWPAEAGVIEAGERRLREEFGFSLALRVAGSFVYRATDPASDLTEYEHDTVLVGSAGDTLTVHPDPNEIAAWRWMPVVGLEQALRDDADSYAPWLPAALPLAVAALRGDRG
jgi:isopentenyl-diphosphate delta-isomerase